MLSTLGTVGKIGLDDAEVTLAVTGESMVKIRVKGSPDLAELRIKTEDEQLNLFANLLLDAADNVVVSQSVEVNVVGLSATFKSTFGSKPVHLKGPLRGTPEREDALAEDNKEWTYVLEDTEQEGPKVFTSTSFGVPPISSIGMEIGVKIWPPEPVTPPLIFQGRVAMTVGVGVRLDGDMEMIGTWNRAFGVPFLHLSDIMAGVSLTLVPPPLLLAPTRLKLGGRACVGSQQVCEDKQPENQFIDVMVYAQVDVTYPTNNFFVGMVSDFTLDHALGAVGCHGTKFYGMVPQFLLTSGISAVKRDCTSDMKADHLKNPDCFARISVAPGETHSVAGLTVPRGYAFSGRLNLYNVIKVSADIKFDPAAWMLDAQVSIDPISVANGALVLSDKVGSTKGPLLVIDIKLGSALVNIRGYMKIVPLGIEMEINVQLNDKGFKAEFQSSSILGTANFNVGWTWNLNKPQLSYSASLELVDLAKLASDVQNKVNEIKEEADAAVEAAVKGLQNSNMADKVCQFVKKLGKDLRSSPAGELGKKVLEEVRKGCTTLFKYLIKGFTLLLEFAYKALSNALQDAIKLALGGLSTTTKYFELRELVIGGTLGGRSGPTYHASAKGSILGKDMELTGVLDPQKMMESLFNLIVAKVPPLKALIEAVGGFDKAIRQVKQAATTILNGAKSCVKGFLLFLPEDQRPSGDAFENCNEEMDNIVTVVKNLGVSDSQMAAAKKKMHEDKDNGDSCVLSFECKSNFCPALSGKCEKPCEKQSDCSSSKFCDTVTKMCTVRGKVGDACGFMCEHKCPHCRHFGGFCTECMSEKHPTAGCDSGEFCDVSVCKRKLGNKELCTSSDQCKDNLVCKGLDGCRYQDKSRNIGQSCDFTSECGKGECCSGKCRNKIKDYMGTWWCPEKVKCKWGTKGFLGKCSSNSHCCSKNCQGYKAAHTKNTWSNCHGKCHPDRKSCRGASYTSFKGYKKVASNKFKHQYCKNGYIYGKKHVSRSCPFGKTGGCCKTAWGSKDRNNCDYNKNTWDNCWGKCHPDKKSCRGAAIYSHAGYRKVASNKFNNQYCRNGYIYGTKRVGTKYGSCSAFGR